MKFILYTSEYSFWYQAMYQLKNLHQVRTMYQRLENIRVWIYEIQFEKEEEKIDNRPVK